MSSTKRRAYCPRSARRQGRLELAEQLADAAVDLLDNGTGLFDREPRWVVEEADAAALATVIAALSDPVRLRLLSLVASSGEICSCNLEAPLRKSQPTISHHTRVLAEAGLIVGEKRGKWTWWRTSPDQLTSVCRVLGDC